MIIIIILQLIEQGQVTILRRPMIKGSRPFYWILLKEANLSYTDIESDNGLLIIFLRGHIKYKVSILDKHIAIDLFRHMNS